MLLIMSPAKLMEMTPAAKNIKSTQPIFQEEVEMLVRKMQTFSASELETLMKLTPGLGQQTYEQFHNFNLPSVPVRQAILAYHGSVFQELDAKTFTPEDFEYAQSHIRIISTLYGVLRPLDMIKAYRMSFHLKLSGMNGENLYAFWKDRLTSMLIEDAQNDDHTIVNLASKEILQALDMKKLENRFKVVNVDFKESKGGGRYEAIRAYSKPAHGALIREIVRKEIDSVEDLKDFTWNRYSFNENISTDNNYLFTR